MLRKGLPTFNRSTTKRGGKKYELNLGDIYKPTFDDIQKDRIVYDLEAENEEEGDLSPNRGPTGERLPGLENEVENAAYINAIREPYLYRHPLDQCYNQKSISDMIKVGSEEYQTYIEQVVQIAEQKAGTHFICLKCWKYLSFHQLRMHERAGHQCAKPGSVRDEQTFMITAKTFGKLTEDGSFVEKLGIFDKSHYIPPRDPNDSDIVKYRNTGDHNGDKGKPPIIGAQMVPVSLMPNPQHTPTDNLPGKSLQSLKTGLTLEDIGEGPMSQGFNQFEKERLVEVLGRVFTRMDFIESNMCDMLHKIRLMMIKDQAQEQQQTFQVIPNDVTMMETNDDWMEDEASLKFN